MLHRKISLCVATSRAPVMESSTEQANSGIGLALYGEVPHERAALMPTAQCQPEHRGGYCRRTTPVRIT
jgi:hypothetical protein